MKVQSYLSCLVRLTIEHTLSSPSIFGLPYSSSFTCCESHVRAHTRTHTLITFILTYRLEEFQILLCDIQYTSKHHQFKYTKNLASYYIKQNSKNNDGFLKYCPSAKWTVQWIDFSLKNFVLQACHRFWFRYIFACQFCLQILFCESVTDECTVNIYIGRFQLE